MTIAGAEEAAQQPTDQPNDNPGKESTPESRDMKAMNHRGDKEEHQRIDDQNEKSHRHDDERQAEQKEDWTNKRVDDAKQECGCKKRPRGVVGNSRDERRCPHDSQSRNEPTNEKFLHDPILSWESQQGNGNELKIPSTQGMKCVMSR